MFPLDLLPKLSPHSAKILLVMIALVDPRRRVPIAKASLADLSRLSALSPRACSRAIRQLKDLRLVKSPPHRYHTAPIYILLAPKSAPNSHDPSSPSQAAIPISRPQNGIKSAPSRAAQPHISASKPQSSPPQASILKTIGPPRIPASPGDHQTHLRQPGAPNLDKLIHEIAAAVRGAK